MDLFDKLERKQKYTFFDNGSEKKFFLSHNSILNPIPPLKRYSRAEDPFEIIRANIIIRAVLNKKKLDETYLEVTRLYRKGGELRHEGEAAVKKAIKAAKSGLPCLPLEGEDIFVPILSRSVNEIYDKNILKFELPQYRMLLGNNYEALLVDPFDSYRGDLFDSNFTNLILVRKSGNTWAFFDYDSLSIYFVTSQGRLESRICLFDRHIGVRNTNHMMERIQPVVDAYLRDDRDGLYKALVDNQLISSRLIYKISTDEKRYFAKLEKKNG